MVKNTIKVYARVKKEKLKEKQNYEIRTRQEHDDLIIYNNGTISYQNSPTSGCFRFHKIFDKSSNQEDIFEVVGKPIVNSVLQGFNGTIFAYGQTGSGKTYTITGSPKNYGERGLIPRCIQEIFSYTETLNVKPVIYISYMEIYNEIGYDLLNKKDSKNVKCLEELPKIIILEDKNHEIHLRNLNVTPVNTEEEAMRLFFYGETNRTIAETPMNEYSSRSHCIFTVYLALRDEIKMRCSKLNIVDLAGSERVHKCKIVGNILLEAKNINLSLHYLQQVILALSEEKRSHIPFRNSVMTYILKDSLYGNCLTSMIATVSFTKSNILETLSTCKFAQRVSLVTTEPIINEIADTQQEILYLKSKIEELQLQLQNSKKVDKLLTKQDEENYEKAIQKFIFSDSNEKLDIEMCHTHVKYCFDLLKKEIIKLREEKDYCNIQNNEKNRSEYEEIKETLEKKLEIAKIHADTIEQCQKNISLIKLRLPQTLSCIEKKSLVSDMEYQQEIYRKSLLQLKELKLETCQLEFALERVKKRSQSQNINKENVCTCYINEHYENGAQDEFCEQAKILQMPVQVYCCKTYENNVYEDEIPVLLKPEGTQSDVTIKSSVESVEINDSNEFKEETSTSLFRVNDSSEFREFMKTVPLTGDVNVDVEICNFYRNKFYV